MRANFYDVIEVELNYRDSSTTFLIEVEFSENRPQTSSDGVHSGGERSIEDVRVFKWKGLHIPGKYTPKEYEKTPLWLQESLREIIDIEKLNSDWSDID